MRVFGKDNGINVVEIAPGIVRRMTDAELERMLHEAAPKAEEAPKPEEAPKKTRKK